MNDIPKTSEAAGVPSKDWEATAERLFERSAALECENTRLRAALHEIAYLQSVWPHWEYQELYESSRGMANEALANVQSEPRTQPEKP